MSASCVIGGDADTHLHHPGRGRVRRRRAHHRAGKPLRRRWAVRSRWRHRRWLSFPLPLPTALAALAGAVGAFGLIAHLRVPGLRGDEPPGRAAGRFRVHLPVHLRRVACVKGSTGTTALRPEDLAGVPAESSRRSPPAASAKRRRWSTASDSRPRRAKSTGSTRRAAPSSRSCATRAQRCTCAPTRSACASQRRPSAPGRRFPVSQIYALSGTIVLVALAIGLVLAYLAFLEGRPQRGDRRLRARAACGSSPAAPAWWCRCSQTWNRLSLEIMTLDVTTPEVYTSQGVPVIVDGVAQIKIKKDEASLHAAAERFLGKAPEEIAKIALETVQGHLRAILGTMTRRGHLQEPRPVRAEGAGDLGRRPRQHGPRHRLVHHPRHPRQARLPRGARQAAHRRGQAHRGHRRGDRVQGSRRSRRPTPSARRASGRPRRSKLAQEAEAKRDAAVAEANADKQRRQQRGRRHRRTAPPRSPTSRPQQAIAEQQGIANRKRAEAEMAYELQKKTMEIQVQEQEIKRKEKELDATIRRQADAKRYEIETLAAADAQRASRPRPTPSEARLDDDRRGREGARHGRGRGGPGAGRRPKARAVAQGARAWPRPRRARRRASPRRWAWRRRPRPGRSTTRPPCCRSSRRSCPRSRARWPSRCRASTASRWSTPAATATVGVSKMTAEIARVIAQVPPVVESLTGLNVEDLLKGLRSKPDTNGGDPQTRPPSYSQPCSQPLGWWRSSRPSPRRPSGRPTWMRCAATALARSGRPSWRSRPCG